MPGLKLPPGLLSQAVAIAFTGGNLFGIYLITVAFANRWLIFADGGWILRKRIRWFMVVITNLIAMLVTIAVSLVIFKLMNEASFAEQGGKLSEWVNPVWNPIVAVSL